MTKSPKHPGKRSKKIRGNVNKTSSRNYYDRLETRILLTTNTPPTLDPPYNVTINQNAGLQTVNLTGISAGAHEAQPVRVTAASNNTGLIPNPAVNYNNARFTPGTTYPGGNTTHDTEIGDFNGDSIDDVIVLNRGNSNVGIYYGSGNGNFQAPVYWGVNSFPNSVAVGDFNRDGRDDFAVTNFESNLTSVRLSTGSSFSAITTFATGNGTAFPASTGADPIETGDFNNDGILDLVVGNTRHHFVSILLGNTSGGFLAPIKSDVDPSNQLLRPSQIGPFGLACADFNNDGKLDVAVALQGRAEAGQDIPGDLRIMLGNGLGSLALSAQLEAGQYCAGIVSDDFNQDGFADIAISARTPAPEIRVFLGNSQANFTLSALLTGGHLGLRTGDVNKDGKKDLISFGNDFFWHQGDGNGAFSGPLSTPNPTGANRSGAIGDFNGDGWIDVAWGVGTGAVNGTMATWLGRNNSTGSLSFTPVANQSGNATITVTVEDGGLDGNLNTTNDNATFNRTFTVTVTPPPEISVTSPVGPISENNSGSQQVFFTISLSAASTQTVKVNYITTIEGYSNPGTPNNDFTPVSGLVEFAPGETSKSVSVQVRGDRLVELDELFGLLIQNPTNGVIREDLADLVITDDDSWAYPQEIDFGNEISPIKSGAVAVGTLPFTSGKGLGWTSGLSNLQIVDRGLGSAGLRDIALTSSSSFAFDVPNGTYILRLTFGDATKAHDQMRVTVEGSNKPLVNTAVNQFITRIFTTTVSDGRLDLGFADMGGADPQVAIAGIAFGRR